ncbi:WD40 repeat-like protein [Hymenopellis radicata]|nr:WD40 repeat-like protein [Hymenopellis radicata]
MDSDNERNDDVDAGESASGFESPLASPTTVAILNRLFQLQRSGFIPAGLSSSNILNILQQRRRDDGYYMWASNRHEKPPPEGWFPQPKEPQAAGVDLLFSGAFGRIGYKSGERGDIPNRSIAQTIQRRLEGRHHRPRLTREDMANHLVPNSNGTAVASYCANIYTAQYSAVVLTQFQDFRLYIYDTYKAADQAGRAEAMHDPHMNTTMSVKRGIQGRPGRWTITDANLSPDNQRLIYSSITPTVYMTSVVDENPVQYPITFSGHHGLYSCTFSADGNEIIAGGNGNISVYDLLGSRETVNIHAHDSDVNSCCWADTASGNVLVSASDDSFLKVWDRRSLGASPKPSGVLIGHTEGITYVSAKGDGRYVISNGKDQSVRLWDLRKLRSPADHSKIANKSYGIPGFDYRYPPYGKPRHEKTPMDCSVMTYRGHSVLRTLIRCKFSPAETTGSQYIYSGSANGKIHIWSLDGTLVQILDRTQTLPLGHDPSAPEDPTPLGKRNVCVRDVSWHSQEPVMMSAAWASNSRGGSILARHEWKGLQKMGGSLEDWVLKQAEEAAEEGSPRRSRRLSELQRRREVTSQMVGAYPPDEYFDEDY